MRLKYDYIQAMFSHTYYLRSKILIHPSSIKVRNMQFKYLFQLPWCLNKIHYSPKR